MKLKDIKGLLPEKKEEWITCKVLPTVQELEDTLTQKDYDVLPNGEIKMKNKEAIAVNKELAELSEKEIELDVEKVAKVIIKKICNDAVAIDTYHTGFTESECCERLAQALSNNLKDIIKIKGE